MDLRVLAKLSEVLGQGSDIPTPGVHRFFKYFDGLLDNLGPLSLKNLNPTTVRE